MIPWNIHFVFELQKVLDTLEDFFIPVIYSKSIGSVSYLMCCSLRCSQSTSIKFVQTGHLSLPLLKSQPHHLLNFREKLLKTTTATMYLALLHSDSQRKMYSRTDQFSPLDSLLYPADCHWGPASVFFRFRHPLFQLIVALHLQFLHWVHRASHHQRYGVQIFFFLVTYRSGL